jgi:hypothetical protein
MLRLLFIVITISLSGCSLGDRCRVVAYWEKDLGNTEKARVELSLYERAR